MKAASLFAGIDIGSNAVKLKIVQFKANKIKVLEDISTDLALGDEAFSTTLISDEMTLKLCKVLNHYANLLSEYEVKHYLAVATSSLRQATNRKFVVDTIKRRTGIWVHIIDDAVEKYLTYKSMKDRVPGYPLYREDGTVIVELTSGGCDVTLYRDNKLLRNDEIGIGTQHLRHMLNKFIEATPNYIPVLETYIETKVNYVSNILKKKKITHYLAVGGEVRTIRDLFLEQRSSIEQASVVALYEKVLQNQEFLIEKCTAAGKDWREILASIIFFKVFLDILNCQVIDIPEVTLRDGLIAELISKFGAETTAYQEFDADPFSASYQIAKRFGSHPGHAKYMERVAGLLFEELKKNYEFNAEDLLVLRHAAFLHEIGKSIDLNDYHSASSLMIQGMRIFGVSQVQIERIAKLCAILGEYYRESEEIYEYNIKDLQLAAILCVVDALDASKTQKMRIQKVDTGKDKLRIYYESKDRPIIEMTAIDDVENLIYKVYDLKLMVEEMA